MNKNILTIKNLTKQFAGAKRPSIKNINLSLSQGRCLGIVGESGSGKSTLARAIAGLIPVSSGEIYFEDRCISKFNFSQYKKIYKDIQMIFQLPRESFNPTRTLGNSIVLNLKNFGITGNYKNNAISLLNRCGLDASFYDKYPNEVSGGECQRAAIARAIAASPKLLICDEATSALDMIVQKKIIALLNSLKEEMGMAILFICHDISLVHHMCDDVAVMKSGHIVEKNFAGQIIHKPKNEYTKALIEASNIY